MTRRDRAAAMQARERDEATRIAERVVGRLSDEEVMLIRFSPMTTAGGR